VPAAELGLRGAWCGAAARRSGNGELAQPASQNRSVNAQRLVCFLGNDRHRSFGTSRGLGMAGVYTKPANTSRPRAPSVGE